MKIESTTPGNKHRPEIAALLETYGKSIRDYAVEPLAQGLINDSFRLCSECDDDLFIQRLNPSAFPDPEALMANILRISQHLQAVDETSPTQLNLRLFPAGRPWWTDATGHHWRVFDLIDGSRALDRPDTPQQARLAAEAFARFSRHLDSLPRPSLNTIIPDFHNTASRLHHLDSALRQHGHPSDQQSLSLLATVDAHRELAHRLDRLPSRAVHNDTKFSNVLFARDTDDVLCVIDLDTCQPGLLAHDFGDMLRSALNPYGEDDPLAGNKPLDLSLFEALCEGYLSGVNGWIGTEETVSLLDGLPVITFELGIRFMTDHLEGDHYFTVDYPQQNLRRAQRQFRMLETTLANWDTLRTRFDNIRLRLPDNHA